MSLTQRDLSVAAAYRYSSLISHPSFISYRQVRWSRSALSACPFFCFLVSLGSSPRIIRGEFLDFVHSTHRIHGALDLKPGTMGMARAELPLHKASPTAAMPPLRGYHKGLSSKTRYLRQQSWYIVKGRH